jgi:hypothetical protein
LNQKAGLIMKKLLSLSVLSVVLAASFAFAPKVRFVDSWTLYNGLVVQGTQAQVKATHCAGANNRFCAQLIGGMAQIQRP